MTFDCKTIDAAHCQDSSTFNDLRDDQAGPPMTTGRIRGMRYDKVFLGHVMPDCLSECLEGPWQRFLHKLALLRCHVVVGVGSAILAGRDKAADGDSLRCSFVGKSLAAAGPHKPRCDKSSELRRFNYILAHEEDLDANEREKPESQQAAIYLQMALSPRKRNVVAGSWISCTEAFCRRRLGRQVKH